MCNDLHMPWGRLWSSGKLQINGVTMQDKEENTWRDTDSYIGFALNLMYTIMCYDKMCY